MEPLFDINGLMFWSQKEIALRERFKAQIAEGVAEFLHGQNPMFLQNFLQVEAPLLTPRSALNPNYTDEDIWAQETLEVSGSHELALRPETTPGSYTYAVHLLNSHSAHKPPMVVWQAGKSFRRENEQPSKHMRLKEFYQQEFQCVYASDTLNDYQEASLEPMRKLLGDIIGLPTRIVESDRLPSYSKRTMDIEVDNGDKWMEVCSISLRTDFPEKFKFVHKGVQKEKDLLVLEIAVGLDRVVYNYLQRTK